METWYLMANRRKIKILREYLKLIKKKEVFPKQASLIICQKYNICRKTIYNYMNKFRDLPLRSL